MANVQIQTINTSENKEKGKGHAKISITGQNLTVSSLSFYIKRNGVDKPNLGQGGWQVADAMLKPDTVTEIEGGLEIYVGPNVVAYMENSNFILGLNFEGSNENIEATMFWENVRPIHPVIKPGRPGGPFGPRSRNKTINPNQEKPVPPPVSKPPESTPLTEPPTEPPPPPEEPKSKKGMIVFLGIIILLLSVAAAGWYFWDQPKSITPQKDDSKAHDQDNTKPMPVKKPETQDPHKRFEVLKNSDLSPEQLYKEGLKFLEEAKTSNNKELIGYAESLFREAGDQDYALGYLAIGKIYDPKDFTSGRSTQLQVSPDKAYHYYNIARETGSVEAEENIIRVRKWVEQQAQQGDPVAQKLLRVWLGQF